ncbi:dTDP-4-dehydrorhamnose reductase (plasmid) [Ensifer adhaerens]|uniref:dTDP-4-dehydrorhamnose reductase n=1 Tax=Ensifer adhaerens TaxID=106592 RepID=UPI0023A91AF9|nr:dTDP-4-dehydrorhamnose reductase [Ensifer adhaerens]WDZ80913.1 dTDP-4-dehydrorhamnose reductase [Ensifer adhaerens]
MSNRRILITGGTGQVGTELLRYPWPEDIQLVAPNRHELDLTDCDSIDQYISTGDFSAVINSGAYTAVDRAESDVVTAWKVNALAPAAIAAASKRIGIPLVHLSTDYVFDGVKNGPYFEGDSVAPLGVYGASKEAGEQAVRTGNPRHVILRTAWVFSAHGTNFVKTMLRLGAQGGLIRVVDDQIGSPTAASDIAMAVATITNLLIERSHAPTGTYGFVNSGQTTWFGFAQEIFRQRKDAGFLVPSLEPIATSQYPSPARRPANSRLSTEKVRRDFALEPRNWVDALKPVVESISSGE